jgi:hypothetical protein
MSILSTQAEPAVQSLLQDDEVQLYEQIGIRSKAIAENPTLAGYFEPSVVYEQAELGLKEDVVELGQHIYQRWNREAYDLVCGSGSKDKKDREELAKAFGVSDVVVAASLAAVIVTNFGIAPAIAAVIAALVVKRFFRPAYEEFCQAWGEHIDEM